MTWTQRNSYEISSDANNIEETLDSIRKVLASKAPEGWSGYISVDIMEVPKSSNVYDLINTPLKVYNPSS